MRFLLTLFLAALPAIALAQDEGSRLERLLEGSLSSQDRDVSIEGFQGVLTGKASLDVLTISDRDGIWLMVEDATLDWNRAALIRGRLEVAELSAKRIEIARRPFPAAVAPEAEASGTGLPELPVSVEILKIAAEQVSFGPDVFGLTAEMSIEGALSLKDGAGNVDIGARRLGGPEGTFDLKAEYANSDGVLELDLLVEEAPNGIVAELLNLPGRPSLALTLGGGGQLDALALELALATDGVARVAGQAITTTTGPEDPVVFSLNVNGDAAPLFAPDYRNFLGEDLALDLSGTRTRAGAIELDQFNLDARSIRLRGSAVVGSDGIPERIDVEGVIADPDGRPVRLPAGETPVILDRADLDLGFDASVGPEWSGELIATRVKIADARIDQMMLEGSGLIARTEQGADLRAVFAYGADRVELASQELSDALGSSVSGTVRLSRKGGGPIVFDGISLTSAFFALDGNGQVELAERDMFFGLSARFESSDLSPFSRLFGRDLSGRAAFDVTAEGRVVGGLVNFALDGETEDLTLSIEKVDPLLAGRTELMAELTRDTTGVSLNALRLASPEVEIVGAANLATRSGRVDMNARLRDVALVLPGANGPAKIRIDADGVDGRWTYGLEADGAGGALDLSGQADLSGEIPVASTQGRISATDLSQFGSFVGRDLGGSVEVVGNVSGTFDLVQLSSDIVVKGESLRLGQRDFDALMRGPFEAEIDVARDGKTIRVETVDLQSESLTAKATGALGDGEDLVELFLRVADIAPFTAGLVGSATATGTVGPIRGDQIYLDLSATGPSGLSATVTGDVALDGKTVDLAFSGQGPSALANRFIAPRSLDGMVDFSGRLSGPVSLDGLDAQVDAPDLRAVAPALGLVFSPLAVRASLSGASAIIDIDAQSESGGRALVSGPISLAGAPGGALSVGLERLRLSDPDLFDTTLSGSLRVDGQLTGGASITGEVALGPTEARVPSTGFGSAVPLEGVTHRNETFSIRQTRVRAGLIEDARNTPNIAYPIDVSLSAPNRIFVRGRGLEAELGGALRATGSTLSPSATGAFELIRGRLDILGRRLTLTEGRVGLEGSLDPALFFVATTRTEEIEVRIVVEGRASAPEFRFESNPSLPDEEVLAQLLFGRGISNLSPLQAAQLASAVATLAGRGGDGVVGRLRSTLGFDNLDLAASESGGTDVTIGRYLGENLYTDVTVGSDGKSEVSLNLDLTPSVSVQGTVGNDGTSSVGLFFQRDY